jgi:hypothetical protein
LGGFTSDLGGSGLGSGEVAAGFATGGVGLLGLAAGLAVPGLGAVGLPVAAGFALGLPFPAAFGFAGGRFWAILVAGGGVGGALFCDMYQIANPAKGTAIKLPIPTALT